MVELWHASSGTGPPIVVCHGGPGMSDYLEPLAALIDDVATVVRYDQRGSARSPAAGPYSVAQFVADLDELRARLGYDHWIVGGHSWGATLALQYAFTYPRRTRALVYISGVGIGTTWRAAYHAEAHRRRTPEQRVRLEVLSDMTQRDTAQEQEWRTLSWLPDYVPGADAWTRAAALAATPYPLNREVNRVINQETRGWAEDALAARAAALTMPVLLVHGELDPRPHWAIDSLAAALANATVVKLSGAAHLPWVEQSAATAAALRTFIQSV